MIIAFKISDEASDGQKSERVNVRKSPNTTLYCYMSTNIHLLNLVLKLETKLTFWNSWKSWRNLPLTRIDNGVILSTFCCSINRSIVSSDQSEIGDRTG
jgi:hypothetical protein